MSAQSLKTVESDANSVAEKRVDAETQSFRSVSYESMSSMRSIRSYSSSISTKLKLKKARFETSYGLDFASG